MKNKNLNNATGFVDKVTFSVLLGALIITPLSAQVYDSNEGMGFIARDMQARGKSETWFVVDPNDHVTIDGKQYVFRKVGMRRYVIPSDSSSPKREVRPVVEDAKRYVSLIEPVTQGNHSILITGVDGAVLIGRSVPTRIYRDASGNFQFKILLQDVTFIKGEGVNKDMPLAYDGEKGCIIFWLKDEQVKIGKTFSNSNKLYLDKYGSFYNEQNCYNKKANKGPLFEEVGSSPDGKHDIRRLFHLVKDEQENVIIKYIGGKVETVKDGHN